MLEIYSSIHSQICQNSVEMLFKCFSSFKDRIGNWIAGRAIFLGIYECWYVFIHPAQDSWGNYSNSIKRNKTWLFILWSQWHYHCRPKRVLLFITLLNALVAVPLYPIFSSKDQKNRTKIHSLVHSRVILILEKILNFTMGIPASCFILFTGFRTVFVFALRRFVPVVVNFLSPQSI